MRKELTAAIVAAAVASGCGGQALAMTPVAPDAGAPAAASLVLPATNVCGSNGCVKVLTSPPRKRLPPNHRP